MQRIKKGESEKDMSVVIPTELGTERVLTLLKRYALPAIIAMAASSLYNIVDSIFIGQGCGPLAIAGLAVTFPLMNLSAAFGTLVGVGALTTISVFLGQRNYEAAQRAFGNALVMNIIVGLLYMAVIFCFLDDILLFFGASENTLPYARDYMRVILIGNVITHEYFGINAMMRSAGMPKEAMYSTILTVFNNTILDALFIMVFGWGITGAAAATVLSQFISLCWVSSLFCNKKRIIHFRKGIYKLEFKFVRDMFAVGMAPFLMNSAACLVVVLINKQLYLYNGDLAIGAYGIVNRVIFLFLMVVMGLNQGMQPIAGFNYGACKYDRVTQVLKYTLTAATVVFTSGFLICEIFAEPISRCFTTDSELIRMAARGMRITICCFPIAAFSMVISNFFQSIRIPSKAIFLSLSRQLIVLLPCLFILPPIFGDDGIWMSMPVSDTIASIIGILLLRNQFRRFKQLDNAKQEKIGN